MDLKSKYSKYGAKICEILSKMLNFNHKDRSDFSELSNHIKVFKL